VDASTVLQHRAVVVADTSRRVDVRGYGVLGGQPSLAVPSMQAKIRAQCEGLGVGWLPRERVAGLLASGALVEKRMADPREPNLLYVAWRGDHQGRALDWWLAQLKHERLASRLVKGIEVS
jgi:DNA-binding transcriptional LysR family regulator